MKRRHSFYDPELVDEKDGIIADSLVLRRHPLGYDLVR